PSATSSTLVPDWEFVITRVLLLGILEREFTLRSRPCKIQPMDLKSVCVYCSSSANPEAAVEKEIRTFGRELVARGVRLIYGGAARGLMGAIADEVLQAGGKVTGIIPKALEGRESAHRGLTELKVVGSMHEREQLMFDLSDAFVAFPGGFG